MVILIDTDAFSHWSDKPDFSKDVELLRKTGACLTVPETVIEEVMAISNPSVRVKRSRNLVDLLDDRPILAQLWNQIIWGGEKFLSGGIAFKPFAAADSRDVKEHLRDGCNLRLGALGELHRKKDKQASSWNTMHEQARPRFQKLLEENASIPNPVILIGTMLKSDVLRDVILERIPDVSQRDALRSRWQEYIVWNPICRCFLELFILAIRRHTIEPENARSKKGPKWEDYYIGAFVGIADRFVTDDKRFRDALHQHQNHSGVPRLEILPLDKFLEQLRDGKLSIGGVPAILEVWPAQVQQG